MDVELPNELLIPESIFTFAKRPESLDFTLASTAPVPALYVLLCVPILCAPSDHELDNFGAIFVPSTLPLPVGLTELITPISE